MNEYADNGVNKSCTNEIVPSSSSSSSPPNVVKVDTTTSLATKPVKIAIPACHVEKPSGAKIGAIAEPIIPRTLSCDPYSTPNGTELKIQITIAEARIMVPAFFKKPLVFSQVCNNTPFRDGTL